MQISHVIITYTVGAEPS